MFNREYHVPIDRLDTREMNVVIAYCTCFSPNANKLFLNKFVRTVGFDELDKSNSLAPGRHRIRKTIACP